jgi:hypothetical protein
LKKRKMMAHSAPIITFPRPHSASCDRRK